MNNTYVYQSAPSWTLLMKAGNTNWMARLSTVNLLIKIASLYKKLNNIYTIQMKTLDLKKYILIQPGACQHRKFHGNGWILRKQKQKHLNNNIAF